MQWRWDSAILFAYHRVKLLPHHWTHKHRADVLSRERAEVPCSGFSYLMLVSSHLFLLFITTINNNNNPLFFKRYLRFFLNHLTHAALLCGITRQSAALCHKVTFLSRISLMLSHYKCTHKCTHKCVKCNSLCTNNIVGLIIEISSQSKMYQTAH